MLPSKWANIYRVRHKPNEQTRIVNIGVIVKLGFLDKSNLTLDNYYKFTTMFHLWIKYVCTSWSSVSFDFLNLWMEEQVMRIPGISVPSYVLSKKWILYKVYSTSILFHKLILRKTIATGNLQVYFRLSVQYITIAQ